MSGGSVRVLVLCCVVGVRSFVFVCARGASLPLLFSSFQLAVANQLSTLRTPVTPAPSSSPYPMSIGSVV